MDNKQNTAFSLSFGTLLSMLWRIQSRMVTIK